MTEAASTLEIGAIAMGLFGGIALFLAGMEQMSQALKEDHFFATTGRA